MSMSFAQYEKYETEKLRPKVLSQKSVKGSLLNVCNFSLQTQSIDTKGATLLNPQIFEKSRAEILEIFKKASLYKKQIVGVILNLSNLSNEDYKHVCEFVKPLFSHQQLVCDIHDKRLIKDKFSRRFGIYLNGKEKDIRQTIAEFKLYNRHETAPIYFNDLQIDEKDREALCYTWHVRFATSVESCGPCISFRRVAYPKQLNSAGAFPVRLWLQNVGTSAEYSTLRIRLAVKTDSGLYPIKLQHKCGIFKQGDITYNEIATLPVLAKGEYTLMCAVVAGTTPLTLANDERCENGFYCFGKLVIVENNNNLSYNVWDDYYPEGYYPLEDPKLPY